MSTGAFTIPSVFTAIDKFSAPINKMGRSMNSFTNRAATGLAVVERGFRRLMSPLTNLNRMFAGLGVYVGLYSFVNLIRDAIRTMAGFEQAMVDISVVTGKSVQENKAFGVQARGFALQYGIAAEEVLKLDNALIKLGFRDDQVLKMSEGILTASVALKGVPEEVGKIIGAIQLAFKIPASQTQQIGDLLSKAADLSALDWSDLQTMLPTAMQSAALAWKGMPAMDQLKQLLALFAAARDAQVHVASGATGIKNMLIDSRLFKGGAKDYKEMLNMIIESPDQIKKAFELFKRRTLVTALPLGEAQKMGSIEDFIGRLTAEAGGYSGRVTQQRLDSTTGKVQLLKIAYEELILSIDDGTGPMAKALKGWLDAGRALFLLNDGSDIAKTALKSLDATAIKTAQSWMFWIKWILKFIAVLAIAKAIMIAWSVVVFAGRAAMFLYSVALGIATAMGYANTLMLKGNTVALVAARIATFLFTGAVRVMSMALAGNPLGLLIVGLGFVLGSLIDVNTEFGLLSGNIDKVAKKKLIDQYNETHHPGGSMKLTEQFKRGMMDVFMPDRSSMLDKQDSAALSFINADKKKEKFDKLWGSNERDSLMYAKLQRDTGADTLSTPGMELIDNASDRQNGLTESIQRQIEQLELTIKTDSGTSAEVTKNTGGIPVKVKSTMVDFKRR